MAYMDDQALERDQQRKRLLANAPQIGLGDPAQQPQGVQAPQAPPAPMLSIESILANLAGSLAPKGVNVTPGEALKTPFTLPNRPGVPTPEKWKSDNTLGAVLQGILGAKGSGIQQLQQRLLQAQQGQRPAPYQARTIAVIRPPQAGRGRERAWRTWWFPAAPCGDRSPLDEQRGQDEARGHPTPA
jgi:hypothetical protein